MQLLTDNLHRIAYATDASAYREMPMAVAYPETVEDVKALLQLARERKTCIIPRAAGTSIAGQVVGNGIVADISRHMNKILEINAEERWARVQPGVVRDELNFALKPHGLFFSPKTSTSNRCCIGGMFGNNSCGSHSLVYGSTRDHVISVKGVLSDGSEFDTSDRNGSDLWSRINNQLETWQSDKKICQQIIDNYPDRSLRRRSCGYAIDEAIFPLQTSEHPNIQTFEISIGNLLAGSEGTLAFITELKLSLDPLPSDKMMVVCAHCNTLENSFEANLIALRNNPVAVELMDGQILELCRHNKEQERNRFFVSGEPAAILIAEFNGDNMEEQAAAFEKEVIDSGLAYCNTRVYGDDIQRVWALRKAGLGVLGGMKGDAKPIGVIEDTAVSPERLPAYMADFRTMLNRLNLSCVYYGHIGTGELHLRPILNIKNRHDRELFRQVAYETALLVKKHHGSLSGEHGDGRLRGEFIPLVYGIECYDLMRQVKHCWDPEGLFNRGKIIDTPPMDTCLRYDQTYFNWKSDFNEHGEVCAPSHASDHEQQNSNFQQIIAQSGHGPTFDNRRALMCSIEQCNGAGDCRKSTLMGGTLCPAFKVSHNETMSTRARANIIREALTHGINGLTITSPEVKEVLYSCLACKGCRSECPSNVDMTRLRAELLQHIYDAKGTPLRTWMVAHMASVQRLGHLVTPIYNLMASWKLSSSVIKRLVSFAPERSIPTLSPKTMRSQYSTNNKAQKSKSPEIQKHVYLFADEFTNYMEAELGITFANLLIRLGYNVIIPQHVESGRAAISKGCLKLAKKYATRNVELLADLVTEDAPLIGIEPSCILSFRDEYPDLVPKTLRKKAKRLGNNSLLFDEFLVREMRKGNISPDSFKDTPVEIWLHGHCHQKALVGIEKTPAVAAVWPAPLATRKSITRPPSPSAR